MTTATDGAIQAPTLGTALITGASAGIGATYADRLARRGYDLILAARDEARLNTLAEKLRGETGRAVGVIRSDLTDPADVARIEATLASNTSITLLINNAGMSLTGNLLTVEPTAIDRLIALNVTAPTRLAAAAARAFVARGGGAIVNVSSVLSQVVEAFDGAYNGTKAHLLTVSRWLNRQLADQGVYVQALLPAATRTEIWQRAGMDIATLPADIVMEVGDLVDAALVGFDAREEVTIPPLADETLWITTDEARAAMVPVLGSNKPAARYREVVPA